MTLAVPQFPLGSVLLPAAGLPLHIFESRYRTMMDDIGPEGRFGVVLIERGRESGGGEVRFDTGCLARIVQTQALPDGRMNLLAVGESRFRVTEWLDDAPYPRAITEPWPDSPTSETDWHPIAAALQDCLNRMVERGAPPFEMPEVSQSPVTASYQLAILAPVGPLDKYRLLTAASVDDRFRLIAQMIDDTNQLIDAMGSI